MLECGLSLIAACLPSISILLTYAKTRFDKSTFRKPRSAGYQDVLDDPKALKTGYDRRDNDAGYYNHSTTPHIKDPDAVLLALDIQDSRDLEMGLWENDKIVDRSS